MAGFLLVALVAFIVGFGVGYVRGYFSTGAVGAEVTVTIPKGSTLSDIAAVLEEKRVVSHARVFVMRAESDGYSSTFKPGIYVFHVNEPYRRLVAMLERGAKPLTVKVVIPEGSTLRQQAKLVSRRISNIAAADYVAAARDDPPPFRLVGYKPGDPLEGMLFPATYEVDPKSTARQLVEKQLAAFDDYFSRVDLTRARKANLTPYDVVIIASMIDREARLARERPLVAAVVWNRLKADMRLQIDATVQYALGKTKPELTYEDLKVDSPFNTYRHAGLPPAPISNPGLAALKAAALPARVGYLYYVARADGTGGHYFSEDYQQFLADKAKAQANGD